MTRGLVVAAGAPIALCVAIGACATLAGIDEPKDRPNDAGDVALDGPIDGPTVHCDSGFAACGSACVDTRGDTKNCGACSHDCQGGMCQQGACQPVTLASGLNGTDDAGVTFFPRAIAVDATAVYWTLTGGSGGGVMKCAKGGCNNQPILLAIGAPTYSIAVDAANVYWTDQTGGVKKCSKSGCNSQPSDLIVPAVGARAYGVAVDGTSVFVTESATCDGGSCCSLAKCATSGCGNTPTVLASVMYAAGLFDAVAVDATNVYWAFLTQVPNGDGVMKCALAGCNNQPTALSMTNDVGAAVAIAVDSTNVYWNGVPGLIKKCAIGGCNNQPSTLISGAGPAPYENSLAVDSTDIYWINTSTGAVQRCATSGCNNTPTTLAFGETRPRGIALDATAVYWTTEDGTVRKVAK